MEESLEHIWRCEETHSKIDKETSEEIRGKFKADERSEQAREELRIIGEGKPCKQMIEYTKKFEKIAKETEKSKSSPEKRKKYIHRNRNS